jgi:hypothetical protein
MTNIRNERSITTGPMDIKRIIKTYYEDPMRDGHRDAQHSAPAQLPHRAGPAAPAVAELGDLREESAGEWSEGGGGASPGRRRRSGSAGSAARGSSCRVSSPFGSSASDCPAAPGRQGRGRGTPKSGRVGGRSGRSGGNPSDSD